MTLAEAARDRAADERDAIVDALFAPLLSEDSTAMEKHRAATGILERMLGKPKDPVVVEELEPGKAVDALPPVPPGNLLTTAPVTSPGGHGAIPPAARIVRRVVTSWPFEQSAR